MSSVSAACIFGAYNASSAHTDTFYIVSQIVRVRNSKRHFFSKLTLPYIIQQLCFHPTTTSTITALLHPTATSTTAAPLHPTATSTTAASLSPYCNIDHNRSASPYGNIDHSRSASPYGHIDHSHSASPYGHIDHSLSFRTTKPFEQLCRKFFVFF